MSVLSAVFPLLALLVIAPPQDTIKTHYDAAEAQRRAGNLAAAETEYTAILAEGYSRLGKIYSAEKDYKKAFEVLESAVSYRPDSEEILIDLAIAYFNAEQYEKALGALGKALARNPQSAGARHMLGKTYFMTGDVDKARIELEAAFKLTPNDYDVSYTLGLAYLRQRRLAEAKQIYDRMLGQLGDRPQLRIIFGRAYRETGFLPEAIEEFKKAIAVDTNFPRAHYYLGLTYLLKDGSARLGDAAEEFKIELISHPDEFFANYYLAILYVIDRKWELAISFLEKAIRIQPNNPDPYFHLGQAYQEIGMDERAVEVLRKTILLNPDLSHNDYQVTTAHYRLGKSLLKTGQIAEGQKELEIASQLKSEGFKKDEEKTTAYLTPGSLREQSGKFPEMPSAEGIIAETKGPDEQTRSNLNDREAYYARVIAAAHENIGLLRADQRDFRGAAEQFGTAAKWNPQLERINYNWGLAAYKAALYKDAVAPLERELAASPSNGAAKQLLGMSYFMTEDYSKAAALLGDVAASKPGDAGLYYPLAVSLMKQGKKEEAERILQQLITAGGNNPQVHILMGQAYQEQGDSAKAIEELNVALRQDAKTLLAHYYEGLIYVRMGKLDQAVREFESELTLDPNNVEAKYHLGFALLESQQTDRGVELMKEVVRLKPDYAEAHYELGKALLQGGEVREAVRSLETAARLRPDESYVHYQLGRAYLAAGRKAEGESQLDMFRRLKDKARNEPRQ